MFSWLGLFSIGGRLPFLFEASHTQNQDQISSIKRFMGTPRSIFSFKVLLDSQKNFILLTSILNACKLTIADIALVNIGNQETSLHQILETLPSSIIMCFDVASADLKIKLPNTLYKVTELGESNLFFSKALSCMQGTSAEAKLEKGTLWILLKKLFAL